MNDKIDLRQLLFKSFLLPLVLVVISTPLLAQNIVINEFMADNKETIQDMDGEFKDWIELYNPNSFPINLANYSLSDNAGDLRQWVFPSVTLSPDSFILIFASGKNRIDTNELHTNFKISSNGENLFLSNSLGVLIDQVMPVNLLEDESYGRVVDGDTLASILSTPSPKASNNGDNYLFFSKQGGFYVAPFYLSIQSVLEDTIYYTLNGAVPTPQSPAFTEALFVDDPSKQANYYSEIPTTLEQCSITFKTWETPNTKVDKAYILRCASFKNGKRTSKIYTHSYFIDDDIAEKYSMPVVSLVSESRHFFSSDSGIYVPGVHTTTDDPERKGNYFERGAAWERPIHIEYYDKSGDLGFSQDAGVRIHGGITRQTAQKSLRLYAKKEYGRDYFKYPLLPHRDHKKYESFVLSTTMGNWNDPTVIADVLAHDIIRDLNMDYLDFKPVIVYLNGEYWGIHTTRDRINKAYIAYTHDLDKDSVSLGNEGYNDLIVFASTQDLSIESNYNYLTSKIDLDNYIDYHIAELFFANLDWPGLNFETWRATSPDAKWRWIFFDLDGGFQDNRYDMLTHATLNNPSILWKNSPYNTALFRNLLQNNTFKNLFLQRYTTLLHTTFSKEVTREKFKKIKKLYVKEMSRHAAR